MRRGRIVEAVRRSPRWSSSTAAAPAASRRPPREAGHRGRRRIGFLHPRLFDFYRGFTAAPPPCSPCPSSAAPRPARHRPRRRLLASGSPGRTGCPSPTCRPDCARPDEGAGEVQTPLLGQAADGPARRRPRLVPSRQGGRTLRTLRRLHLIEGDKVVDEVPTYRGEGPRVRLRLPPRCHQRQKGSAQRATAWLAWSGSTSRPCVGGSRRRVRRVPQLPPVRLGRRPGCCADAPRGLEVPGRDQTDLLGSTGPCRGTTRWSPRSPPTRSPRSWRSSSSGTTSSTSPCFPAVSADEGLRIGPDVFGRLARMQQTG